MQYRKTIRFVGALGLGLALAACNPDADADRRGAPGVEQPDGDLASRVRHALRDDTATTDLSIELDVQDGTVQLNGFVDTSEEKAAAGRVARGVAGVGNIQNNLVVGDTEQPLGQDIDDATLRLRVEAALATDDDAPARQINVEVLDGVVQLSGFVESGAEKQEAAELVRAMNGVREVKNDIAVRADGDDTPVQPNDRDGDGVKNKRDLHDGVGDEKPRR